MDERLQTLRKYNLWDSAPFDFGYERIIFHACVETQQIKQKIAK
ncbi:hypothetical protein [Bacteroides heparinolyticus]